MIVTVPSTPLSVSAQNGYLHVVNASWLRNGALQSVRDTSQNPAGSSRIVNCQNRRVHSTMQLRRGDASRNFTGATPRTNIGTQNRPALCAEPGELAVNTEPADMAKGGKHPVRFQSRKLSRFVIASLGLASVIDCFLFLVSGSPFRTEIRFACL